MNAKVKKNALLKRHFPNLKLGESPSIGDWLKADNQSPGVSDRYLVLQQLERDQANRAEIIRLNNRVIDALMMYWESRGVRFK